MHHNQLRPYQQRAIDGVYRLIADGRRRIVIVAPCGAGKTRIASQLILEAIAAGKRCLFLAHRKELLEQCSSTLTSLKVRHDLVMAGNPYGIPAGEMACVASIQTLARRQFPEADVVIIDEAHRSRAKTYMRFIEHYADAVVLGLTATPVRTDKKVLGMIFEDMVAVADVRELIDGGYLIDPLVYAPVTDLDLSDVRIKNGDYMDSDLMRVMGKAKITADIFDTWEKRGKGRPTICFAVNRDHGKMLTAAFKERGVKADFLDGTTHAGAREGMIEAFRAGHVEVLVNVSVLTEGFDHPPTSCVILARPTKSLTVYMQACGRAMRTAPGKLDAIILDHAGCALVHGLPGDSRAYTLDDSDADKGPSPVKVCNGCQGVVRASAKVCPHCGYEFAAKDDGDGDSKKGPEFVDGELAPMTRDQVTCKTCNTSNTLRTPAKDQSFSKAYYCRTCKRPLWVQNEAAIRSATDTQRRQEYERLCAIQAKKNLKPGFPNSAYRAMFGKWPPKEWQQAKEA